MSTELSTLLHNQLGDILKRHLATKGEHPFAADKAVDLVLPAIVAAILTHVNGSRDKAMALYNKIMDERSELHGAVQNAITSGNIAPNITELGQHFASSILGSDQAHVVAAHIGKESSVSDESATSLLNSALPLVLAVLRSQNWSPAGLYQILSNQSCWLTKALPAGIMIALGIGSSAGLSASVAALASTLSGYVASAATNAAAGSTVTAATAAAAAPMAAAGSGGSGWVKALVWLALAAAAIFGLRMCMNDDKASNTTATKPQISQSSETSGSSNNSNGGATDNLAASGSLNDTGSATASSDENKNADNSAAAASSENQNSENTANTAASSSDENKQSGDGAATSSSETNQSDDKASNSSEENKSDDKTTSSSDENKSDENTNAAANSGSLNESANTPPPANESRAVLEDGMVKFYFATGFSRLAKNADEVAKEAIEAGKAGKKLTISGFTDSTGKAAANEKLSKKRAEVVKKFFIERGVDEKNIVLRKPKNSVGAKGESQEGRRVEVQITD